MLRKIDENGASELASTAMTSAASGVDLKVVSKGKTYDFLFSTDRGDSWTTVMADVDARHTSTAAAGGFTGTTVGLYASKTK